MALERVPQECFVGGWNLLLLQLVRKMKLVLLVDHGGEGNVLVRDLEKVGYFLHLDFQLSRDLLRRRVALQLQRELGNGLPDAVQEVRLLLGEAERPTMIREGVNDGLADPPDRVGDELDVLLGIESLGGLDEPDVPFIDEIEKGQTAAAVLLGEAHHEPEVRLYEPLESLLAPLLDAIAENFL